MGISNRCLTRGRHRLRRHHVAVVRAIPSVTHVLIAVVVVLIFVVLLSSRFFLLDKPHHIIR